MVFPLLMVGYAVSGLIGTSVLGYGTWKLVGGAKTQNSDNEPEIESTEAANGTIRVKVKRCENNNREKITGYEVEWKDNDSTTPERTISHNYHQIEITGLTAGHNYKVRVRAVIEGSRSYSKWSTPKTVLLNVRPTLAPIITGNLRGHIDNLRNIYNNDILQNHYNILVCGMKGAGKTTLQNNLLKTIDPDPCLKVVGSSQSNHHITFKLEKVKVSNGNVKFWNIWGSSEQIENTFREDFLKKLLEGKILTAELDESKKKIVNDTYNNNPGIEDRVHCAIIVVSMNNWRNGNERNAINLFKNACEKMNIQPFYVMTKADEIDKTLVDPTNHKNLYDSFSVQNELNCFIQEMGLSHDAVIPFISCPEYHSEQTEVQEYLGLKIMHKVAVNCKSNIKG